MQSLFLSILLLLFFSAANAQINPANDPEAGALLKKVSEKYQSYKNISADFRLYIIRPKLKPDQDERKLTDTITGKVLLQQNKFRIDMNGQEIICDGKNVWTYIRDDKEVQVNYYEESDDALSPSKIFNLFREGYLYGIKEKKTSGGKNVTVIEMSPSGIKASYFKIDISIDPTAEQLTESKIYEKNGVRYVYKLNRQSFNTPIKDDTFNFDERRYPGVKVVDLR